MSSCPTLSKSHRSCEEEVIILTAWLIPFLIFKVILIFLTHCYNCFLCVLCKMIDLPRQCTFLSQPSKVFPFKEPVYDKILLPAVIGLFGIYPILREFFFSFTRLEFFLRKKLKCNIVKMYGSRWCHCKTPAERGGW